MGCRAGGGGGGTLCLFAYKPSTDKDENTENKLNGSVTKDMERNRGNQNKLSYKNGNDSEKFLPYILRLCRCFQCCTI
jgi:hypothetical protein